MPPLWTESNAPRPDQVASENEQREKVRQVLDTLPAGVTYQSAGSTIGCGETAPNSGVIKCIAFSLPAATALSHRVFGEFVSLFAQRRYATLPSR